MQGNVKAGQGSVRVPASVSLAKASNQVLRVQVRVAL